MPGHSSVPSSPYHPYNFRQQAVLRLKLTRLVKMALKSGEIRLLDILPCDNNDTQAPVHCELRVAAPLDKPLYEVLSYRWGDPTHRTSVTVDNSELLITLNLHAALIRIRRQEGKRTIWIDQLCIDQSNIEERIAQVHLMREIYSSCTQCLIWVDEISNTITRADAESIIDVLSWMGDQTLPTPPCLASSSAFHGPAPIET